MLEGENIRLILEILNVKDLHDLYIQIGQDLFSPGLFLYYLDSAHGREEPKKQDEAKSPEGRNIIPVSSLDKAIFKFARCCNPLPGQDNVVATLSERGIAFHERNCQDLHERHSLQPQQMLDVRWSAGTAWPHPLIFHIHIFEQNLRELLPSLAALPERIQVRHISSALDKHDRRMVWIGVVLNSFAEAREFFNLLPREHTVVDEFGREGGPREFQPESCRLS